MKRAKAILKQMRPHTASGKSWKVLAAKRGTLRNIGDGTPRKARAR